MNIILIHLIIYFQKKDKKIYSYIPRINWPDFFMRTAFERRAQYRSFGSPTPSNYEDTIGRFNNLNYAIASYKLSDRFGNDLLEYKSIPNIIEVVGMRIEKMTPLDILSDLILP